MKIPDKLFLIEKLENPAPKLRAGQVAGPPDPASMPHVPAGAKGWAAPGKMPKKGWREVRQATASEVKGLRDAFGGAETDGHPHLGPKVFFFF
jgi:hypothetical protein